MGSIAISNLVNGSNTGLNFLFDPYILGFANYSPQGKKVSSVLSCPRLDCIALG